MSDIKKILVAEDELTNSLLLKRLLTKTGYSVVVAHNGADALKLIERESFDILLTDWMMPQMDGIELIRRIREKIKPIPLIVMVTALVSESAKTYALESGADDFVAKPIDIDELLTRIKDGANRKTQDAPKPVSKIEEIVVEVTPPFVGCVIATSTGGPPTLIQLFKDITQETNAAFYIVQHGPPWMLETFSQRLQRETKLKVNLAKNGMKTLAGNIYIAPGDYHLKINTDYTISLDNGPKENFVRPAADPMFRSAAKAFGKYLFAVVLTGLGRDASQGAASVFSVGGSVLVQDPDTAVAPSMPRTVIESGIKHKVVSLAEMGKTLNESIFPLSARLKKELAEKK